MAERIIPTKQVFMNEVTFSWDNVSWEWPVVFINPDDGCAGFYCSYFDGGAYYYTVPRVADTFKSGVWLLNGPELVEPTKDTLRADFDALQPPAIMNLRIKLVEISWDHGMSVYIAKDGDHDVYGHTRSILNFYNTCRCKVDYVWLDDVLPDKPGDKYRDGLWILN